MIGSNDVIERQSQGDIPRLLAGFNFWFSLRLTPLPHSFHPRSQTLKYVPLSPTAVPTFSLLSSINLSYDIWTYRHSGRPICRD
jgi:hypothetical protein